MEHQKYQKLVEDFVYHITKIKKLSENTIKNYQYDLSQFDNFIDGRDITQELVNEYKDHLDKISIMKGEMTRAGVFAILKKLAQEIGANDPKCPQVTGKTERTIKKQEQEKEA